MFKFNNGIGAIICDKCRTVIKSGVDPRKYKEESTGIDLCENCHLVEVDNFKLIGNLLEFENRDEFYFLQVIQRKKDGNVTQVGNNGYRCIKTYYIYSKEQLYNKMDKIKELCFSNNARAYIHLNRRNAKDIALGCIQHYAQLVSEGNANQGYRVYDSVCGKLRDKCYKPLWILDVDVKDEEYVNAVKHWAMKSRGCEEYKRIFATIPTVNGYHVITRGFDVKQFSEYCREDGIEAIDIQKDNPTLLYYVKPE